ncbi:single-stranded DNA-binding protein [Microbacterium sp. NPDC056052]|uniref:single-stranded DNA-binding protein n=1 Tax=Microbacterium sp. NPDC056052 TaxID=3345695 RepID=UPI0035E30ECD
MSREEQIMADTITVLGNVASDPDRGATATGIPTLSFRMATNHRRPDGAGGWIDAGTNWFEIRAYRALAENAEASLSKGDAVVVVGRLKLREWDAKDGKRMNAEIEAESIGPDLRRGRSVYHRVSHQASPRAEGAAGDSGGASVGVAASAGAGAGAGVAVGVTAGVGAPDAAADAWATPGSDATPF